jgi:hypothetical protein
MTYRLADKVFLSVITTALCALIAVPSGFVVYMILAADPVEGDVRGPVPPVAVYMLVFSLLTWICTLLYIATRPTDKDSVQGSAE